MLNPKYDALLAEPLFLQALEIIKTLKPLSVPIAVNVGEKEQFFHVRRTRHNHFNFLRAAFELDVSMPEPVLNITDKDTHRFYLVTTYGPVKPLANFIADSKVSNQRKLETLKNIADNLTKLNNAKMRYGNVLHENIYIRENGEAMLYDPEMDEELLTHIQGDLEQFREMLFHLERDLYHEPSALWETVKNDPFFKSLK